MKTLKDKRLEQLIDKVRMRIPIDLVDASEVIAYQENLKKRKKKSFVCKVLALFKESVSKMSANWHRAKEVN